MSRFAGFVGILLLLMSSLTFAYLNSGHRVTLRFGVGTLYAVPLTVVVFGSVIVGMVVMLVAGVRSDLKVRRILRVRLAEEDREERERFIDTSQQDLFTEAAAHPEVVDVEGEMHAGLTYGEEEGRRAFDAEEETHPEVSRGEKGMHPPPLPNGLDA